MSIDTDRYYQVAVERMKAIDAACWQAMENGPGWRVAASDPVMERTDDFRYMINTKITLLPPGAAPGFGPCTIYGPFPEYARDLLMFRGDFSC